MYELNIKKCKPSQLMAACDSQLKTNAGTCTIVSGAFLQTSVTQAARPLEMSMTTRRLALYEDLVSLREILVCFAG